MSRKKRRLLIVVGALVAAVSAGVTVLYVFQPWRSCPYDDTSAGCGMLTGDAVVMLLAIVGVLVGGTLVVAGLVGPRRTRRLSAAGRA